MARIVDNDTLPTATAELAQKQNAMIAVGCMQGGGDNGDDNMMMMMMIIILSLKVSRNARIGNNTPSNLHNFSVLAQAFNIARVEYYSA